MSYAGATKKIELEKKGASLNVPFCRPTSEKDWETNNPISRVNHRSSVQEKAQQASRPRPNPHQLQCCELKKKMSEDVWLLVKKNDFLAFICAVIDKATALPQGSDKVNSIVNIAIDFLGFISQASKIKKMLKWKYDG